MTDDMNQITGSGGLLVDDNQRIKEMFAKLSPAQKVFFIAQAAYFLEAQSLPSFAPGLPAAANL